MNQKLHFSKRLLCCLTLLVLLFWVVTAAATPFLSSLSTEERQWLAEHPKLRLGIGVAFPPFMWVEKVEGQLVFKGMISDYIDLLSRKLAVEMELVLDIPFNEALEQGRSGQIDLFPCLTKTPERSDFLLFTEPYLSYPLVIITREDAPIIGGIEDLDGKRLAVVKHLMVYSKLQVESKDVDLNFVFTSKVEENLEAVSMARADACIINLAAASYFIQKKGLTNLSIAAPVNWRGIQFSMGIRKDRPILHSIISKAQASISQEEKDLISQRWIRAKFEPGVKIDVIVRWAIGTGLGITVFFAFFWTWNRRLRNEVHERQNAENALKENERKLQTLVGNLPGIAYSCINDRNWTMIYISDGCKFLTGYEPKELIQNNVRSYNDLIVPEDREYVWQETQAAIDKNEPFTIEYRIRDKNNKVKWVWEKSRCVVGQNEGESLLEGFINDITEFKLAEEELRNSEEKFRALFEQSGGYCMILDPNTPDGIPVIIDANEAALKAHGYTYDEFIGRPVADIDDEDGKRLVKTRTKEIMLGNPFYVENVHVRKDGTTFHVAVNAKRIDVGGAPPLILTTEFDITERKESEAERERLKMAIEQSGETIVITDSEGIIQFVNRAFEKETGYTRDEAIGHKPSILKSGKHDNEFYSKLWSTITSGNIFQGRLVNKRKDGTLYTEFATISPVIDAEGRIINYVAVKRDITEQLEMENQLLQSQKMESIGQLAGGIAHDYNNMLSVIIGNTELVLDEVDETGTLYEDLLEIREAANRSADITRQLLGFARKQTIIPEVLDLNEIIGNTLKMLERLIGEDIKMSWQPMADLWKVKIDPTQLEQIFTNLCVNARHAISGIGNIIIETGNTSFDEFYCAQHPGSKPGDYVSLMVSDDGCGIKEEDQRHIFEPFFTTKDVGEGTGLGLATVYGIVKQNNGYIWVYSEPGEGTLIKIYLPRHIESIADFEDNSVKALPPKSHGETVLIAEDEPATLKLAKRILEGQGYTVLDATTAKSALDLAWQYRKQIKVLLTDVIMPDMNGRDLAAEIQTNCPDLKVVYMSGYTADIIARHGILSDGVNFIQKPFDRTELALKIRSVLGQDRA